MDFLPKLLPINDESGKITYIDNYTEKSTEDCGDDERQPVRRMHKFDRKEAVRLIMFSLAIAVYRIVRRVMSNAI